MRQGLRTMVVPFPGVEGEEVEDSDLMADHEFEISEISASPKQDR